MPRHACMHLPLHLPLQSEHTHACPSPSLYPYPSGCLDRSLLCARRVDVVPLRLQVHRRTLRLRLLRLPSAAAAAAAAAAATLGPHVVEAARRPLGTGRDAARRGWLRRRDTPATRLVRGRRICTWYTGYGLRRGDAKAREGWGRRPPTTCETVRARAVSSPAKTPESCIVLKLCTARCTWSGSGPGLGSGLKLWWG